MDIALIIIGVIVLLAAGFEIVPALWQALRWGPRPKTGTDAISEGTVSQPFTQRPDASIADGKVRAVGTIWNATCSVDLAASLEVGDRVNVDRVDGLILLVSRIDETPAQEAN